METIEEAIKMISAGLPTAERLEIDVRRCFLLTDALREGHKRKFSASKQLKVRATFLLANIPTITTYHLFVKV